MRSAVRGKDGWGDVIFVLIAWIVFSSITAMMCWKEVIRPLLRQPTAYSSQGRSISFAEVVKGSYHTVWIDPKTLR